MSELERAFAMKISKGLIIAKPDDCVYDVAHLMKDHDIGAVVIMENEKLAGIVSERDIVRRLIIKKMDPCTTCVKDIMTKQVTTANLKDGLDKIYGMLCEIPFRHLPIMDGDKLVGITSKRDILYSIKPQNR